MIFVEQIINPIQYAY